MKTSLALLCASRVSAELPRVVCVGPFGSRSQPFLSSSLVTHPWLCAAVCGAAGGNGISECESELVPRHVLGVEVHRARIQ